MLLWQIAGVTGAAILIFLVAILFDIGCKYNVQLMFGAVRAGAEEPTFSLFPSKRHILLFLIVCLFIYCYLKHIKDVSLPVIVLLIIWVIYGYFLYSDSISEIEGKNIKS